MYKILNKIHSSADVQALTTDELELLCTELRKAILENVSKTGGHLASNLGAVEITAAIHRVYDTDKDRLVFDVGHQCYAHKMISGRLDEFPSLRKFEGISGFPKPRESASDACIS
ncbi:MAG: 1-deoxy-D-xylulose-5-phosphate synthase, partial [Oscillospiraceae bacterium]|nr:1-deoxy-D-xylulose-5-phosphate synthase [Oscillospiraceae bacterium]